MALLHSAFSPDTDIDPNILSSKVKVLFVNIKLYWIDNKFFAETWVKALRMFIDLIFNGLYADIVVYVCV